MTLSWLRDRHRRELLTEPFPDAWLGFLQANVLQYSRLTEDEQAKLRDDLRIFIAEKYWEGCGGLTITDEVKVTISALACFLVLHIPHDFYANVESILVYPTSYLAPVEHRDVGGVIEESQSARLGEAWSRGPIVLSWADAYQGGRNSDDGRNVVFHEFAHKLDLREGSVDGVPHLETEQQYSEWAEVMSAEYEHLVTQSESHHATLLDPYGATNGGEFFAVATEAFFEKPRQMHEKHPRLYAVLRGFYHQDPAARISP